MKEIIEKFRSRMSEQEDKFQLPGDMSPSEIASVILNKIKEVSTLPADVRYKGGVRKIQLTNFGTVSKRDQIIKDLDNAGYILNKVEPYRFGLYISAVTKYYKLLRGGKKEYISIILYHGAQSMSRLGLKAEEQAAESINAFLKNNGLEEQYFAKATGRTGPGHDVEIRNPSGELTHAIEVKRSKSSRVDFGQFKIKYNPSSGWQMATGKDNETLKTIFSIIKTKMDEKVQPTEGPYTSSFKRSGAEKFWNQHSPGRTLSPSGDVMRFEIPKKLIQEYYRQKGDDFIILGNDIFSLSNNILPTLESGLVSAYVIFRIKDHSGSFSYTVALRGKFRDTPNTDFGRALAKIFTR